MKRNIFMHILTAVVLITAPITAHADPPLNQPLLIISEIKIKNDTAGYDEYVEISNVSSGPVNVHEYSIDYFNAHTPAATPTPVRATIGTGILSAGQSFVLAKNKTQIPNAETLPLSSLSDSAGQLRLIKGENEIVDSIAWSSSSSAAVHPIMHIPSSAASKSLSRHMVTEADESTLWSWTLSVPDPVSFILSPLPMEPPVPDEDPVEVVPPEVEFSQPEEEDPVEVIEPDVVLALLPEESKDLLPLQITELLPNPAAPQSDAVDEFVEIYNPNSEPIELDGYRLQTGKTYAYHHTFVDAEIPALSYIIISSGETNISLANSVGKARLLDTAGVVVSETPEYADGPEGSAWALIDGTWQWTTTPSPEAINILSMPRPPEKKPTAPQAKVPKAKSSAKSTPTKVARTPAAKVASAKTSGTAKNKTKKEDEPVVAASVSQEPPAPLHPVVLYSVGALAIGYAVYEYRYDISNRWYWVRRYFAMRRASRAQLLDE